MRTTKTVAALAAVASLGLVQPAFAATAAKQTAAMSAKHATKHHNAKVEKTTKTNSAVAPKKK